MREDEAESAPDRGWIRDPDSMNLDYFEPVWIGSHAYPGKIPEGLREMIGSCENPPNSYIRSCADQV